MTRHVLYVAHPLAPTEEDVESARARLMLVHGDPLEGWSIERLAKRALSSNLQRALRWLAWLRKSFPETTFIAPWIASVMSGDDDSDPKQREAGLVDDCAVVERCDGIVLCGGRISGGMRREMEHRWGAHEDGGPFQQEVYDLTRMGAEPPAAEPVIALRPGQTERPFSFQIWCSTGRRTG